jgi:hypothetical protein
MWTGLEVNRENQVYIDVLSLKGRSEPEHIYSHGSFDNVAKIKYLGMTVIN